MATLAELEARLKAVRKERFELRPGLEVGDPAARARDRELASENIYLENAVARAKNEQENTYTLIRVFADGWEIKDQTGRTVALGRSPEEVIERARENGARSEDLARIPPPPPPQPPPGDFTIRQTVTGAWAIDFGPRPIAEARTPEEAIAVVRNRIQTVLEPGSVPPLTDAIATDLVNRANTILAEQKAREEKAAADQGPGTVSAGETTAEAQEARDTGANPQNPTDAPTGNTASISNAESSQPQTPGELPQAPKLPAAQAQGTSVVPTASNSSSPAPGSGVRALKQDAFGTTQQSYVYRALSCVSRFRGGQFTQDLEGTQMQFSNAQIRAVSNQVVPAGSPAAGGASAGSSVASVTGSTATQAEARGVDNAIAAAQTPNQSAAESARLAAAGRTPDQSSAETARLAAQAGRIAAGAVAGTPAAALGTGLVTTAAGAAGINPSLVPFASPGATNVIGALGAAAPALASATGNPQITRAAQALVPAQSFVATSLGQPVGLGQLNSTGASQSVVARTPTVTVNLIAGGTATVTTVDQALALYSQGRISLEQRDRALSQLASLAASQQPQQTVNRQPVGYEP